MKLTRVGGDYLLAVLLLAATGLVTGEEMFAALALGLSFASLISLLILKWRSPVAVEVEVLESRVRVFKHEEGTIVVRIPGLRDPWAHVELESANVEGPVNTTVIRRRPDEVLLSVRPSTAGRFTTVRIQLGYQDAIGLFSVKRDIQLADVVIDSLPLSLLAQAKRAFVPPLVVGESPAGAAGKGQEFYGIEEYTERSESKDILWKRAAKEPNRPLLARVREANNPEYVAIRVIHGRMDDVARTKCIDLQCEALGGLGGALLLAGIGIQMIGPDGTAYYAHDDDELVESIMELSLGRLAEGPAEYLAGRITISLVLGEVEEESMAALIRTPMVLIGGRTVVADRCGIVFTGEEDLTGIVNLVLAT